MNYSILDIHTLTVLRILELMKFLKVQSAFHGFALLKHFNSMDIAMPNALSHIFIKLNRIISIDVLLYAKQVLKLIILQKYAHVQNM